MSRLVAIFAALGALAACNTGPAYYEQGDVTYDALKAAHDACVAKGGTFQVKPGGEPTHLGDYECLGAKDK